MPDKTFFSGNAILGILGGGQLGKMLLQCTRTWDIHTRVLDPDPEAPARLACNEFIQGKLSDYDTVYQFGKKCDVLSIEIEHVNTEALLQLKKEGLVIHPDPQALITIQDKGLQKQFFEQHALPSPAFRLFLNKAEILQAIEDKNLNFPFVQKSRKDGYDGRGVQVIRNEADIPKLMDVPCLTEDLVDIQTEIAVIAARNTQGDVICYDPVSMEFVEEANMLDLLLYPAPLAPSLCKQAQELASALIEKLNICGLLAVEFLVDKNNTLWINEVAPRPHNSGHQTIESTVTSQYEQHLRGILGFPLGSVDVIRASAMVNLLGAPGHQGDVLYEGMEECLAADGVHVHIYGKRQTRPFRKMGHATVTAEQLEQAKNKALWVKQTLKVISRS
ncbi:MAG TPA: 5-(carboxyamino)imidazole ribonucleotide synthase [Chitinophagaceae bacterium]|nr:5-(carboxyamino)imidazole ribonucleotide synthase [Chitinophagaceae bacterium]HNF72002.1 5-(carboxyamino)imidazole ribonucleotide synthase [Chitinophagaceae bacterium]